MAIFARQFMMRALPVFAASIVSILLITHNRALPALNTSGEPGFATCDLPCWAGVMPALTPFREALKIITANLPGWSLNVQASNAQIGFYGSLDEDRIGGVIYEDRGSVGRIRLDVNFPLWYLIEVLGSPYCVRANHLSSINLNVVLVYWRLGNMSVTGVVTLNPLEKWYPGTQTEALLMMTSYEQCALIDAHPWMGFARLWLYQTESAN
jgi:hypothetical protein